jgi:hypothetical protein
MVTFDPDTEEFLSALKEGSSETYRPGLAHFRQYLISLPDPSWKASEAPLKLFLDRVAKDQNLPARERKRVARTILRGFVVYLKDREFLPKSIHTYINPVQSMAAYFEVEGITIRFINMPKAKAKTKLHPWTVTDFEKFMVLLEKPMYQAITFWHAWQGRPLKRKILRLLLEKLWENSNNLNSLFDYFLRKLFKPSGAITYSVGFNKL